MEDFVCTALEFLDEHSATIVATLLGIFGGAIVTHIYNRKSSKNLQASIEVLRGENGNLSGNLDDLVRAFREFSRSVAPKQPETAREIRSILNRVVEAAPYIYSEDQPCPNCGEHALKFSRYGVGPLGPANAWYGCTKCNSEFHSMESPND